MKHNNTFYMQLSRAIFTEEYKDLSNNAKWLFVVLNELEQRYTGRKEKWFFRTDEELAEDCGWSLRTFKRAKKELAETDLVRIGKMHYADQKSGTKSKVHKTSYEIIR